MTKNEKTGLLLAGLAVVGVILIVKNKDEDCACNGEFDNFRRSSGRIKSASGTCKKVCSENKTLYFKCGTQAPPCPSLLTQALWG